MGLTSARASAGCKQRNRDGDHIARLNALTGISDKCGPVLSLIKNSSAGSSAQRVNMR